jgi:hypothetical protein
MIQPEQRQIRKRTARKTIFSYFNSMASRLMSWVSVHPSPSCTNRSRSRQPRERRHTPYTVFDPTDHLQIVPHRQTLLSLSLKSSLSSRQHLRCSGGIRISVLRPDGQPTAYSLPSPCNIPLSVSVLRRKGTPGLLFGVRTITYHVRTRRTGERISKYQLNASQHRGVLNSLATGTF